jgi:AcrR family transcriptional regulator
MSNQMMRPVVEPVLSALLATPDSESVLDRAFAEALEPTAHEDEVSVRPLDAARDQFSRMGIRRSTMEDVARRAGVSRITAYRRFATKDALVEQVVRREFRRYFVQRFVAGRLRRERHAGHVSADVEMMTRISASFLLTPSTVVDLDDDEQLRTVARRFLVPMLS